MIAGDSHVRALGGPLKSADGQHRLVEVAHPGSEVAVLAGTWPRDFDVYWDAVLDHAPGRIVAILWGGNRHLAHYLFAPSPLFDFISSSNPDLPLDDHAQIIPEEAMRAFLVPPIRQIGERIDALRAAAAKVLISGTPPPKEDDAFLRARMAKEPHFTRIAASLGADAATLPFSPPLLRLKMWLALQDLLQEMAQRTGATFVPVPAAAQTGPGYLARSCYGDDVTHANRHYGKIMLAELLAASAASD